MRATERRILLVDDDASARAILRQAVGGRAVVRECRSAEEALALLRRRHFDVVVTDHLMGFMQGTELLEIIAREYPHIRRVMATAYADAERTVGKAGMAHAVLRKPIDVAIARAMILGG